MVVRHRHPEIAQEVLRKGVAARCRVERRTAGIAEHRPDCQRDRDPTAHRPRANTVFGMVIVSPSDRETRMPQRRRAEDTLSRGRRMVDPGDYLPLIGVLMLAGTTVISIAGAYVLGRSRRRDLPSTRADPELAERMERVERLMEVMAIEVERIGEGQRFVVKVMSDRNLGLGCRQTSRTGTSDHAPLVADARAQAGVGCQSSKRFPSGSAAQPNFPYPSSITLSETHTPAARSCSSIASRFLTR